MTSTSRRIRGAIAIASAFALVALAAACGDDDAAAPATTGASVTTIAPAATTGTAAMAEPDGEAFQVPTDNCPPDATEPLADGEPIKIAFVGPQTGPLASFGVVGDGMQIYFDKINEAGGIDGHELQLVEKDDAYDPAKSGPAVQEALEGDQVFATLFQTGTPNVAGTRQMYADACVPQALVGSGFPAWGDPQNWPWTTGGILTYNVESQVWIDFIKEKFPDAKRIALLSFNNDFGKVYQTAVNELAPEAGLEVVADVLHEATSDLTNEVTQLLASDPDIILGGTTSSFCPNLMTLARQSGFTGPMIISYTCQAIEVYMAPAGDAAANAYTLVTVKDPTDQAYADDPGMQQFIADVEQYGGGVDPTDGNLETGWTMGFLLDDALRRAVASPQGLTRASLMNALWSFDITPPLALGGVAKVDGINDAYVNEYGVMAEYDPATTSYKVAEGVEIDVEGDGGLFNSG